MAWPGAAPLRSPAPPVPQRLGPAAPNFARSSPPLPGGGGGGSSLLPLLPRSVCAERRPLQLIPSLSLMQIACWPPRPGFHPLLPSQTRSLTPPREGGEAAGPPGTPLPPPRPRRRRQPPRSRQRPPLPGRDGAVPLSAPLQRGVPSAASGTRGLPAASPLRGQGGKLPSGPPRREGTFSARAGRPAGVLSARAASPRPPHSAAAPRREARGAGSCFSGPPGPWAHGEGQRRP